MAPAVQVGLSFTFKLLLHIIHTIPIQVPQTEKHLIHLMDLHTNSSYIWPFRLFAGKKSVVIKNVLNSVQLYHKRIRWISISSRLTRSASFKWSTARRRLACDETLAARFDTLTHDKAQHVLVGLEGHPGPLETKMTSAVSQWLVYIKNKYVSRPAQAWLAEAFF